VKSGKAAFLSDNVRIGQLPAPRQDGSFGNYFLLLFFFLTRVQSGGQPSHMTLLVPATSQQQKMLITSTPSTVINFKMVSAQT